MHHHWLRRSRYTSLIWRYDGPMELANSDESSRQLLSSEESGEVSWDAWDFVAGLSQASHVHEHRDMSRILFVVFELTLHGYSVAFRGGITEGIESHHPVALEQGITLFWHYEQGCDNLSPLRRARRSRFVTTTSWKATNFSKGQVAFDENQAKVTEDNQLKEAKWRKEPSSVPNHET